MSLKRVVVTGIGALTPIGNNQNEFWNSLVKGVSGAGRISHFDAALFKTQFACELKNFDPLDYFDRKAARKMDPYTQYAVISASEAVQDAHLQDETLDKDRIGVIMASGIGGIGTFHDAVTQFNEGDGTPRYNPFFIPKMISDIAAGQISIQYGFRGPNYATVSACASSTHALIDGFNLIRLGKADIMLCGGAEAAVTIDGIGGFNAMKALSTRNDDPETASRPFDLNRDGFVLGEGSGSIVLEELEHAKARGARIYAEVSGSGMTADAFHMTAPHPEGLGARNVMKETIREAGIEAKDVDYINVHGTSTPLGDVAELKAIQAVFGEASYQLNISSTKSMTGHLLGAAGAVEGIVAILSIVHNIVPPTINHFTDDPAIDTNLNLTFNQAQERHIDIALSNTFGFGGHNACILFKRFI